MDIAKIIKFSLDICRGMLHLSSEGIIHRDLACRNLLVTFKYNSKHKKKLLIDSKTKNSWIKIIHVKFPILEWPGFFKMEIMQQRNQQLDRMINHI